MVVEHVMLIVNSAPNINFIETLNKTIISTSLIKICYCFDSILFIRMIYREWDEISAYLMHILAWILVVIVYPFFLYLESIYLLLAGFTQQWCDWASQLAGDIPYLTGNNVLKSGAQICGWKFFIELYWLKVDSRFAPSRWETALLCNDGSHWLGGNLESALLACSALCWMKMQAQWVPL